MYRQTEASVTRHSSLIGLFMSQWFIQVQRTNGKETVKKFWRCDT